MANGDYWNRGRREGFQQSSSLDTLERLLGIGSNIAGKVQANRDRRESYNTKMIGILAGNYDSEYNNNILDENIRAVKGYRNKNMDSMGAESTDFVETILSQMESQQNQNLKFTTDMSMLDTVTKKAENWAVDIYDNWETKTDDERKALINSGATDSTGIPYSENYAEAKKKEFLKISSEWANSKGNLSQYDSRRLTGLHTSKMAHLEVIVNGALDLYEDGIMSPLEIETIRNSVASGNGKDIQQLLTVQAGQEANVATSLFRELGTYQKNIQAGKDILQSGQDTVKYGQIKNLLPRTPEGLTIDDLTNEYSDKDDYIINLNDGSTIANVRKQQIENNIRKNQQSLKEKDEVYSKSVGKSYIREFNLSDDFLGIEQDPKPKPKPDPKPDLTPKLNTSKRLGLNESLLDIDSNITNIKKDKMIPRIKDRTQKLIEMEKSINEIEVGKDYNLKDKGFDDKQINKINRWNNKNYKRTKYRSRDEVLRRSNKNLNETLGSLDNESPLSYENLKTIQSKFEDDTKEYNKIVSDMNILKEIGDTNTQEYKNLMKKEEEYGVKWLGWWKDKKGKIRKNSNNPAGDYGMYGIGSNKYELEKRLSFYEDLLKGFIDSDSNKLEKIIKHSQ